MTDTQNNMHMIYKRMFRNNHGSGVHIETVGETRIKMMDGTGRSNDTSANWNLEYNNDAYGRGGLEGEVEATEDDETTRYRLEMDNNDLAQIFSAPQRQGLLNKRLMDDFQMPRRRRMMPRMEESDVEEPIKMFVMDERPVMDDSLMQMMRAVQGANRRVNPNRSRRMRIEYVSGPRHSLRHGRRSGRNRSYKWNRRNNLMNPMRRTRRRRSLRIKKPSSSEKQSFRSNLPLTEINA
jgi:hypothetical protein